MDEKAVVSMVVGMVLKMADCLDILMVDRMVAQLVVEMVYQQVELKGEKLAAFLVGTKAALLAGQRAAVLGEIMVVVTVEHQEIVLVANSVGKMAAQLDT